MQTNADDGVEQAKHLTTEEFRSRFEQSELGQKIGEQLKSPVKSFNNENLITMTKKQYANPWYRSLELLVRREALLWWRDKYAIKAKVVQSK